MVPSNQSPTWQTFSPSAGPKLRQLLWQILQESRFRHVALHLTQVFATSNH